MGMCVPPCVCKWNNFLNNVEFYVYEYFTCMCTSYVPAILGGQKKMFGFPKLELGMVARQHMEVRDQS